MSLDQKLQDVLLDVIDRSGDGVSAAWHFSLGDEDAMATRNERSTLHGRDTHILSIALAACRAASSGEVRWTDDVLIEGGSVHDEGDSGILRFLQTPLSMSLENVLRLMIVRSDVEAQRALRHRVGEAAIASAEADLGFLRSAQTDDSSHDPSGVELQSVVRAFESVERAARDPRDAQQLGLVAEEARHLWRVLARQQCTTGAVQLLPKFTSVSHLPIEWDLAIAHVGSVLRGPAGGLRFGVYIEVDEGDVDAVPPRVRARRLVAQLVREAFNHVAEPEVGRGNNE